MGIKEIFENTMTINTIYFYVAAICVFMTGCTGHKVKITQLSEQIIKSTHKSPHDLSEITTFSSRLHKYNLSEKKLQKYPNKTINRLYKALRSITFLFPDWNTDVLLQEKVLKEKIHRRVYNDYDLEKMYETYLAARMFKKAIGIKNQFSKVQFPSMPETILSDNPSGAKLWRVYDVPDDGKTANLKILSLEKGLKVIMTMLPGCSVAEKAMADIMEDSELSKVFKKHGAVITKTFNAESVSLWKSHFNLSNVYIANKASDFPGFNLSSSPNFYFLKNGKIIFQFVGWGGIDELKECKAEMHKGFEAISVFLSSDSIHSN